MWHCQMNRVNTKVRRTKDKSHWPQQRGIVSSCWVCRAALWLVCQWGCACTRLSGIVCVSVTLSIYAVRVNLGSQSKRLRHVHGWLSWFGKPCGKWRNLQNGHKNVCGVDWWRVLRWRQTLSRSHVERSSTNSLDHYDSVRCTKQSLILLYDIT